MAPRGKQTIVQRIALDGGKEIQRELATLGAAGERAFDQLRSAVIQANGPMAVLAARMTTLRAAFAQTADTGRLLGQQVAQLGSRFGVLVGVAGIGGATAALVGFVRASVKAVDEAQEQAQALGITIQQYNVYRAIASQSGIEARQLARAFQQINKALANQTGELRVAAPVIGQFFSFMEKGARRSVLATAENISKLEDIARGATEQAIPEIGKFFSFIEKGVRRTVLITAENFQMFSTKFAQEMAIAGKGLSPITKAFLELGIGLKNAKGQAKTLEEALPEVADKFKNMEDGARKSGLAIDLFTERVGPRMIPFLNQGAAAIDNIKKKFQQLGIGTAIDTERAQVVNKFQDTFDTVVEGLRKLREDMSVEVARILINPMEELVEGLIANRAQLQEVMIQIGRSVGNFAKDLINAFTFIRNEAGQLEFINQEKVSEANRFLISLRDGFIAAGRTIAAVWNQLIKPVFNALLEAANLVAKVVNAIFGSELTGGAVILLAIVGRITGAFKLLGLAVRLVANISATLVAGIGVLAATLSGMIGPGTTATAMLARFAAGFGLALSALFAFVTPFAGWPLLLIAGLATLATYWDDVHKLMVNAWDRIIALFEKNAGKNGVLAQLWKDMNESFEEERQKFNKQNNAMIDKFFKDSWSQFLVDLETTWAAIWDKITAIGQSALDRVKGFLQSVLDKVLAAARAIGNLASGGGGGSSSESIAPQFARGGPVRGRGTSTSDSIPAWLSSGEFVMRAAAVRRYGLGFLEMLNGLRAPARARMGVPAFAMGGLVDGALRRPSSFPTLITEPNRLPGKTFDLHIGGETFQNVYAPEETASRLVRYAVQQSARTSGRKPTWYKG